MDTKHTTTPQNKPGDACITYRPGVQATRPDALSRRSDGYPPETDHGTRADPANVATLLPAPLFAARAAAPATDDHRTMPVTAEQIREILATYHDHPTAGHPGVAATIELVRRHHSWPTLSRDVAEYVATCSACKRAKTPRHRPYGLLLPLPAPSRPFASISMDHIEGLPESAGDGRTYNAILVVVDRLTKYCIFIPANNTDRTEDLASALFSRVFSYFGLPDDIVSDRGRTFVSNLWRNILSTLGTRASMSTAYHPQTDGQTERTNQTLEVFLRFYLNYQQSDWATWLPHAQLALNNRVSATTTLPPALPLFGFTPRTLPGSPALSPQGSRPSPDSFQLLLDTCRRNIARAADAMATYANRSRMDRSFTPGEDVLLRTKHLRHDRPSRKLANPMAGPFRILEAVGSRAYRLDLPGSWKVHPVFHVSLLEPYRKDSRVTDHAPAANALVDDRQDFEVQEIRDTRVTRKGREYLVKWAGYSETTWEPARNLDNCRELLQEFRAQRRRPRNPGTSA